MGSIRPSALLLTGGASTRMGIDKATLVLGGESLATRTARILRTVADPVLAVGAEAGTGLPTVDDPREGPLVAVSAGAAALAAMGAAGPVLVVACDLPFLEAGLLAFLADELGEASAVVPVAGGRDQPLCACYALDALAERAGTLATAGERSMRALLAGLPRVIRVPERRWRAVAAEAALLDVDTPSQWDTARRLAPHDGD